MITAIIFAANLTFSNLFVDLARVPKRAAVTDAATNLEHSYAKGGKKKGSGKGKNKGGKGKGGTGKGGKGKGGKGKGGKGDKGNGKTVGDIKKEQDARNQYQQCLDAQQQSLLQKQYLSDTYRECQSSTISIQDLQIRREALDKCRADYQAGVETIPSYDCNSLRPTRT